jgi:hypothetical protein
MHLYFIDINYVLKYGMKILYFRLINHLKNDSVCRNLRNELNVTHRNKSQHYLFWLLVIMCDLITR